MLRVDLSKELLKYQDNKIMNICLPQEFGATKTFMMKLTSPSFVWYLGLMLASSLSACGRGGDSGQTTPITPSTPSTPVVINKPEPLVNNTNLVNGLAINNFNNNDIISYPLPLLYGLTKTNVTSVKLENAGQTYRTTALVGIF